VEKARIVGHSHGGSVATHYTLEHKDMVKNLILLSPSLHGYHVDNPFWKELQELGMKGDREGIKKKMLEHDMLKRFSKESEEYKLLTTFISDYSCWHFLNKDMAKKYNGYERLEELRDIPTKVAYGEYEEDSVKEISNVFKDRTRAEVIEIEGVGHMTNLEKPEIINDLIEN
jgi:pimeloyl-ACP methyl ester carboxylesterase